MAYEKAGVVALPGHMHTVKTAKGMVTVTGCDGKRLRLLVVFSGIVSPTTSLKDLRRLDDVETPIALWLRACGDEPMVEEAQLIAHDVDEASDNVLAKVTSSLLRQQSVYSAAVDPIARLLNGAFAGLAVASGLGTSLVIALSPSARWCDFEVLRAVGASGRSIRHAEASRQYASVSAGMILGALLDILVSSGVGTAFFLCMGGTVEDALPPLDLVCVLPAKATTIGAVNYFILRTLTGKHLAQSIRLMGHKSDSRE